MRRKLLFAMLCAPSFALAGAFPLVDADRQATIICSAAGAKPPEKAWKFEVGPDDPYRELRKYIAKTTRRGLKVLAEDDPQAASAPFPVYVGDCRVTREVLGETLNKLDRDGYVILVEPRRVFIAGPRPLATYRGVCHFLREHLGVRWLLPGPLGEDVVRRQRVVIKPVRLVEEPVFLARQWSGMGYAKGGVEWCLRHRTHMASFYARHTFSHNTQNIFDPDKHYDQHPSFYPMRGGKRFRPKHGAHNWQPCMTDPGAVKHAADTARQLVATGAPLPQIAAKMRDIGPPMTKPDFEREFKRRVGRDKLAHFPITRRGLLGGKSMPGTIHTEVLLITQRLVPEVIAEFQRRGNLDGAAIRDEIDRRITAAFTPGGSAGYQVSVKHLRQMALKVARVRRVQKPPVIDGVLSDPIWTGTKARGQFTIRGTMTGATYPTTVGLAHDGRDLFVALSCSQDTSTLVAEATKRDDAVWKGDCVEVFVRSADRPNTWAQFALNAAGGLYDRWDDGTGARQSHDFSCQWAAKVHPDRWTAELRVSLAEMQISPARHQILRMNVVRNVAGKPGEISTWFPEPKAGAHAVLSNQMWAILE